MTVLSERSIRSTTSTTARFARATDTIALTAVLVDLVALSAAGLIAVWGRERTHLFSTQAEVSSGLGVVGPLALLAWLGSIYVVGGYRRDVFGVGPDEFKRVSHASVYAAAIIGIGCYLTKFDLSRGFFLLLFAIGGPLVLLGRYGLRLGVKRIRRRGGLAQRVLIAGAPTRVDEVAAVLRREPWLGYQVVGALTPPESTDAETPCGVPVVGNPDDLAVVVDADADVVFFAGGTNSSALAMREAVWQLEQHSVQLVVAPYMTDISSDRLSLRPVGGLPLVHVEPPTWANATRLGKRMFDLLGSTLILVAVGPIMLGTALWVKLYDRGPVMFRHTRVGRDGVPFACLKFRSMVRDADRLIAQMREDRGQDALFFKVKDDPRITAPGRFIRRFSIDELPQLFNVFMGHMSLVGPRPQVEAEVKLYDHAMARRLHVRPGLTGLWQVSGRSDLSKEEAARLDLYYVDNWSMLQDLAILARTFGAVVGSKGAY